MDKNVYVLVKIDNRLCLISAGVIEQEEKSVSTMLFYLLSSNPYKGYKVRISCYHAKTLAYAWGSLISATPFIFRSKDDYYIEHCEVIKEHCTIEEYKKRIKKELLF